MKRLTVRTPKGAALEMGDLYLNEGAARADLMERYLVAVERLAAYEDMGLTPQEVTELLRSLAEAKKNVPLTLDEMREMDGEPIWIQDIDSPGRSCYWLCYWDRGKYLILTSKHLGSYILEDYGKTWLAYRRKPEDWE